MAAKDYYFILGIPRSASGRSIRSAFHALAKKLHPDHAGPGSEGPFRDVVEAYEVLSDPLRREQYNAMLRAAGPRAEPLKQDVEPFAEERSSVATGDHFGRVHDALFQGLGFGSGSARARVHRLDVVLTSEEARGGTIVPVAVSLPGPCPRCAGSGWSWACPRCGGRCWARSWHSFGVAIPPGVRTGETLDYSLWPAGVRDQLVRLRIHVRPRGGD